MVWIVCQTVVIFFGGVCMYESVWVCVCVLQLVYAEALAEQIIVFGWL